MTSRTASEADQVMLLDELRHGCPLVLNDIAVGPETPLKGEILSRPRALLHEKLDAVFAAISRNGKISDVFPAMLKRQLAFAGQAMQQRNYNNISINLPGTVFASPRKREIVDMLMAYESPGKITLEITENCPIGDLDACRDDFNRLAEAGYRFALDDLGDDFHDLTDGDNLAYVDSVMQTIPIASVKISYTLARDLDCNGRHIRRNLELFNDLCAARGHQAGSMEVTFECWNEDADWRAQTESLLPSARVTYQKNTPGIPHSDLR